MNQSSVVQGTITTSPLQVHLGCAQDTHLLTWIEAFLLDRKAQNMAKGTLQFYQKKLRLLVEFCDTQAVTQIDQIDPGLLRQYLLWLEEKGHNPGGCHAPYRTVKTFLRWWDQEVEPAQWKNPIQKVKAPKVALEPLEPVSLDTVKSLIDACPKYTLAGARDRAIFLCLLDTGARASEFINIDLADINPITGQILIREGKGRKPRTVFIGQKSRKALRQYLRLRTDNFPALWVIDDQSGRLSYWGLKGVVKRRSRLAGVLTPELHAFRRQFALSCLRAGMNVYSLQNLMGHADLQVLRRYLKQTEGDLKEGHAKYSPVDMM